MKSLTWTSNKTDTSTQHEKIYFDFLCFFRLTLDQNILKNKPYVGPFGRKLNHTLLDAAQKLKYKVTNRDCLGTAQNLFGDTYNITVILKWR